MTTENSTPAPAEPAPKSGGKLRLIKWLILALVVLVVLGGVVLWLNLNRIIRRTVETQASASMNVPAKLGGAHLSLLGGSLSLDDFLIGSPAGFKGEQMMSLGNLDVNVKLGELRGEPIKISSILIRDPKLVIEMQGTSFNIKKFIDSLPPSESEPIKLVIGSLDVNGAQVVLKPDVAALSSVPGIGQNLAGLKQEYTLNIPALKLENVGTGEGNQNGAAIKEVVSLLITQMAAKASQSEQLPPELRQILSLNVNDLAGSLKAKLGEKVNEQLGKIGGDLTKNLPPDAGKAIEQGLGGLLALKEKKKAATQRATAPAK